MVTRKDIGQRVEDEFGRVGILRDVIKDWEDPAALPWERRRQTVAFIGHERSGCEWVVPSEEVQRADAPGSPRLT
ncbi:hypothetical protein [Streptomyces palmae]|uniref:PRC-barrel domain containing protein n=1 Tax=Streptomyces palmae TaxID=1701085 RepID=A0A4Z0H5M0_9ACTN|nr:hypothetical protein [Streptomyces palmae]TGB06932.1 hypothetical protein E4099_17775 [Streptomyces palmae]